MILKENNGMYQTCCIGTLLKSENLCVCDFGISFNKKKQLLFLLSCTDPS